MILKYLSSIFYLSLISVLFVACGGGGGGGSSSVSSSNNNYGVFVDDVVQGLKYKTKNIEGYTNERGEFPFFNEKVEFFIGKVKIGEVSTLKTDKKVFIQDLFDLDRSEVNDTRVLKIATFLQSLDGDSSTNKIEISEEDFSKYDDIEGSLLDYDTKTLLESKGHREKPSAEVREHLIKSYGENNKESFNQKEKDFLYESLKNRYYWKDHVPSNSYSHYLNPNNMIKDFKYKAIDKWSYAETFEEYYKDSAQEDSGFGCYFNGTTSIFFMEIDSPCDKAGLQRGDELIKINGQSVTTESYAAARLNNGVEVTFTVLRNGSEVNLKITPSIYTYKASKYSIINSNTNKKVGYYIYNTFSSRSTEEIDEAFTYFKNEEINELVVDLRFNGGGSLNTASYLLDKLAAFNHEGKIQYYEKYTPTNEKTEKKFIKANNSIDLSRIFFLTSNNTASASELVINSLKPYMDVKVIGSKTSGKPVGMTGQYTSSNYIYWLINLSFYNANNIGEYFNGLSVDCSITDNRTIDIGDSEEFLLKEAISYIDYNLCSSNKNIDTDKDGIPNYLDSDDDNDGVEDSLDAFPLNANEQKDTDKDGIGNNRDNDDDNDGIIDAQDPLPLTKTEWFYTQMDKEGIVYLFNKSESKIYRWNTLAKKFLTPISVNDNLNTMSYSKDHNRLYLGYKNGEVKYIDLEDSTLTQSSFVKLVISVGDLLSVGKYILIEPDRTTRSIKYIYDKSANEVSATVSYRSKVSFWDTINNRYYFISSGISPSDLYYHEIDQETGVISKEVETKYHGSYEHIAPIRSSLDGTKVVLGNGNIYKTSDLTIQNSISDRVIDATSRTNGELVYLYDNNGDTILKRVSSSLVSLEIVKYEGSIVQIIRQSDDRMFIVTKTNKLNFYEYIPSSDTDKDGIENINDSFPLDVAASIDNDSDGFPDRWNDGYSQSDSTTGLKLDFYPNNIDCNLAEHGNGTTCDFERFIPIFTPDDIGIDKNGIIYLLNKNKKRIYRWNSSTKQYLDPLGINVDMNKMAYVESHDRLYFGYESGEIEYIDLEGNTLKLKNFIGLPQSVKGLTSTGKFLFAQDNSGGWATHYTYDKNAVLKHSIDFTYYSNYYTWDEVNDKVYFFRDDSSPNDLIYENINQDTGEISKEVDSPYHGDYTIKGPIIVSPDGTKILLGSGDIYNGSDLTISSSISDNIESGIYRVNNEIVYTYNLNDKTILKRRDSNLSLIEEQTYEGEIIKIVKVSNDKFIVITKKDKLIFNEYTPN